MLEADLPSLAQEAEESGLDFLSKYQAPLIIDEIQYAPKLLRYLKHVIDEKRESYGQYLLTGSQQFGMMAGVTESLAGRISVMACHTLSAAEVERWNGQRTNRQKLLEYMFLGGYPEIHARGLPPDRFYSDYVATYLERDVRQLLQVRNLRDFDRFMRLAALRTGQLLSLNSMAADLGVSPNTLKSWISVLESSHIVKLVEPYYRNLGKRLVKTPKLYFLDTGLACFLAGLRSVQELESSALLGAMFETHVLGQMIRWHTSRGQTENIYFYRDHYGVEVDFVIPVGLKLKLYECKWSEKPTLPIKSFESLRALVGPDGILSQSIITPERDRRQTAGGIWIEDSVELASLNPI